jgi:chemotaxis protein CheZ
MAHIRRELAALGAGGAGTGSAELFQSSLDQLNALADEIAAAADRMMTACEGIQDAADAIGAKTKHRGIKAQLKKITAGTGDIFEACSFQDLTGQRIGKLTRTVAAFQTGFHAIARHAVGKAGGKGAGNGLAGGQKRHYAIDRIDGGITLEGPQINDPAVSQTDIDSLFD